MKVCGNELKSVPPLKLQKVFQNSATVRMLFIEEFGMELYAEDWPRRMLHRLNV